MTTTRQFVACVFRAGEKRTYTYHNDGELVAVGDSVKIADRSGDSWKRVEVVSISDEAPSFATKPILGKIEPEPAPIGDLLDAGDDSDLEAGPR